MVLPSPGGAPAALAVPAAGLTSHCSIHGPARTWSPKLFAKMTPVTRLPIDLALDLQTFVAALAIKPTAVLPRSSQNLCSGLPHGLQVAARRRLGKS